MLLVALAAPAAAREDAGSPATDRPAATGCTLSRLGTQFVRCDDLTGDGVRAPLWVPVLRSVLARRVSG